MAERDPFGRLPDENPLAGLGSLSDGIDSQAPAQPVVSGRPEEGQRQDRPGRPAAREEPSPPPKRRPATTPSAERSQQQTLRELLGAVQQIKTPRRGGASGLGVLRTVERVIWIVRFVIVVAIVLAVGGAAAGVFTTGSIRDKINEQLPNTELPKDTFGEPGAQSVPKPVGLGKDSLLLQRNLAPALKHMRTSGLGRLKSLSIRPERIDAQLVTRDGRLRSVQQRFDGKLGELSISGGGFGQLPTISFKRANSAAPGRLARGAARRVRQPVSKVDYVVLISSGATTLWTVVMKSGAQFLGDARGHITRRIS